MSLLDDGSNYPPGISPGDYVEIALRCPECGYRWMAQGWRELGMTDLVNEEDGQCQNCLRGWGEQDV